VSFATINLCVASQRVFIFVVYFVIDSDRKIMNTSSYFLMAQAVTGKVSPSCKVSDFSMECPQLVTGPQKRLS
jgi:hypothetical protein